MTGRDALKAWLDKEGRKAKWLAARIDVPATTLSKWLNGHARPILENRLAIEQVTGVRADSWR